ncbi:MAG: hypothetical protein ACKKL5_03215 [Candidatus Komeilibacteria bacterium]
MDDLVTIQDLWRYLQQTLLLINKNGKILLWTQGCVDEFGYDAKIALRRSNWSFLFADKKQLQLVQSKLHPLIKESVQVDLVNEKGDKFLGRLFLRGLQWQSQPHWLVEISNISHQNKVSRQVNELKIQAREKTLAFERASELLKQKERLLIANMTEMKRLYNQVKRSESALQEKTRELEDKVKQLNRFNKLMVGRELKMVELKQEIKQLRVALGERASRQ